MKLLALAGRRLSCWVGAGMLLAGANSAYTQPFIPSFQVTITAPTNGASFTAPANVLIDAETYDSNNVASVVFTAAPGGWGVRPLYVINLGTSSNGVPVGGFGSQEELFSFTWTNVPVGTWVLTAQAILSNGLPWLEPISRPVVITVGGSSDLSVDIASPTNGAIFSAPADIQLIAGAIANVGAVASVQFFDGLTSLGIVSNGVVVDPPGSPGLPPGGRAYMLNWNNASVGFHYLTAVATDTNGQSAVSAMVQITVITNYPPVVRITSPPDNSVFRAPVDIALLAYASDGEESVSNVQFFAGTNSLGFGQPVLFAHPGPVTTNLPIWPILPLNMFELIWSNPPADSYVLTAVTEFGTGVSVTSAPVDITVLTQPPPPTNMTDVVNIEATDPIAIEGTNCWPWLGLTNPITNAPPTWSNWMSPTAPFGWFTNCGPKDATFAIRRWGETNNDVTVNYTIGGTASNGVDYVTLPGTLEIPAGQREAMITIVPIDNDTNNTPETVILSLTLSTNSSPDYFVGFPPRAEALIVNSGLPQPLLTGAMPSGHTFLLTGRMLGDRTFCLSMNGPAGGWFRIDYSTNCLSWTPVCTNQVVDGSINFADPSAANLAARWYRAVPLASPPSN
jgi:hypothetical protein